MSSSSIESLPYDILLKILSFTFYVNAKSLLFANKSLFKYFFHKQVWKSLLEGYDPLSIQKIVRNLTYSQSATIHQLLLPQLQETVRQVSRASNPQQVKWHQIPYFRESQRIPRMEGHGMVSIADRYIAIVCAWGNHLRDNSIRVIDGWATPTTILPIPTSTINVPRDFRYGFSTTVYKTEVFIYGGCLQGGYGGDCNDLYRIQFIFERKNSSNAEEVVQTHLREESVDTIAGAPVKYWDRVVATYSPNLKKTASRENPASSLIGMNQTNGCSRAYHAAVILHYRQKDHLMVFGGIHRQQSIFRMELYDIHNAVWSAAEYEGNAPSPRFGCSCVATQLSQLLDYSTINRYIVTGGSDGSDLCRDGDELDDLYILDVVRSEDGVNDRLVWTKVFKATLFAPERCHSAVYFQDHIIYFGGGALTTSSTKILSLKRLNEMLGEDKNEEGYYEEDTSLIFRPKILPELKSSPPARLDGKALMIGSQMIIFGGFSRTSRELGDFWSLDLGPGPKAFDRLHSPLSEEGEEGDNEGNEGLETFRTLFTRRSGGEGEQSNNDFDEEEDEEEMTVENHFFNHLILQNPLFAQLFQQFANVGEEEEDWDEDEEGNNNDDSDSDYDDEDENLEEEEGEKKEDD